MRLKYIHFHIGRSGLIFSACSPEGSTRWGQKPMFPMIWWKVSLYGDPLMPSDPNTIHLTSLIKGATPLWVTPAVLLKRPLLTWHFLLPENIA